MHNSTKSVLKAALLYPAMAILAACSLTPEQEADAIEQGILSTPGAEDLWATIKAEYPEEFDALVEQIRALDPAEKSDEARVRTH